MNNQFDNQRFFASQRVIADLNKKIQEVYKYKPFPTIHFIVFFGCWYLLPAASFNIYKEGVDYETNKDLKSISISIEWLCFEFTIDVTDIYRRMRKGWGVKASFVFELNVSK